MNAGVFSFLKSRNPFPAWLRFGLAALLIAAGVFCFFPRKVRCDGVRIPASGDELIPPEKSRDYEARQTFVAEKDRLSGVVLLAATFGKKPKKLSGTGEAMLFDAAGNLCDAQKFPLRRLSDNRPFRIRFKVQEKSAKKKWTVVLKLKRCAFYLADRKGDAELRLNGVRQPFMLKLWTEHLDRDGFANARPHAYDFRFFAGFVLFAAAVPLLWRKAGKAIPGGVLSDVAVPFYVVLFAFCLLYREYVFGSKVYIFSDIGCDTLDQYIPVLKNFLHDRSGSEFSVSQALWTDGSAFNFTRFDPFNYLLFMLPSPALAAGLLYILFVKYELLALVSFRYFRLVFADRKSALIGCMLWTFTQFNLLWGQHYFFLTVVVFFTVLMLLMELFLRGKKLAAVPFVAVAAWLSCFQFYYFYMFCLFAVFYIAGRVFLRKESVGALLRQWCAVGGCLIFAISLGLFQIVPWLQAFLYSDRVNPGIAIKELFAVKPQYVGTVAGRLLCPGFFGADRIYLDYYTAPNIFISLLGIFTVAGLLFVRPRIRIWSIAVPAGIAVLLPAFSFLMTMSPVQTRWIFMLHFVFVSGIVLFLREARTCSKNEKVLLFLCATILFLILLFAGFLEWLRGFNAPFANLQFSPLVFAAVFAAVHLLLYGCLLAFPLPDKIFYGLLIPVFVSELVFGYEPLIGDRLTVKKGDKTYSVITGGRHRDFHKLLPENAEFARTELSVGSSRGITADLPTLFSAPGASAYNSIRPAALGTFAPEHIFEDNPNVFEIRSSYLANRLLGIKRIAVDHDGIPYPGSFRARSGEWKLFEMPKCRFGYVLPADAECPPPADDTACQDRFLLMYSHWWKTADRVRPPCRKEHYEPGKGFYRFLHQPGNPVEVYRPLTTDLRLCPGLTGAFRPPCDVVFDRPLQIDLPKPAAETGAYILLVDAESFSPSNLELSDRFAKSRFPLFAGRHKYVFFIPFRNISSFHISGRFATLKIHDLELIHDPAFFRRLDELAGQFDVSPVRNVKFGGEVWSADVENRSGNDAMLCVPFSYLPGWTATVNGEAVPVLNINNGLLGIRLPRNGGNPVVLRRSPPGRRLVRIVSLAAFVLLVVGAAVLAVREKRRGTGAALAS